MNKRRCSLDNIQIVREFIDLSSSLSCRYTISAICMLNDYKAPGLQNWATSCIHEAVRIIRSENDALKIEAQVFISRIRAVLKTSLMMRIFDGNNGTIEKMIDVPVVIESPSKKQIADSQEVSALTDLDPECELIAFEIKSICKGLSIPFRRLQPSALTESAIQECLDSDDQDIDHKIIERCLARRVIDQLIGHTSSFRVVRIVSPALSILSEGNPGESKKYSTRDR